ncbi:MAG: type II secretion system F family protein [Actinomycetes bacterium]
MTAAAILAGCSAGLAVALAGRQRMSARSRLSGTRACPARGPGPPVPAERTTGRSRGATLLACGIATAASVLMLGWLAVLAAAAPAAVLVGGRRLRVRAAHRREAAECARQLPRAADLVAACLDAGATPADALDVVRGHIGDPLAARLAPAAVALRMGADPVPDYRDATARRVPRDDPAWALVRALARALDSGAPVAASVASVADDERRRQRWAAEAAARRAGVLAVGPLALCFLPAFVLLGVVPVVLGIALDVLGGLS